MFIPKPNESSNFTPPPAGTHMATCYRVVDLGTQQTDYQGEAKRQHKIVVSWELPHEMMEDGKPYTVHKRYTFSMSEKATLRHHLEAWRGRPFEDKDFGEGGFNLRKLLGIGCMLGVLHSTKDGKTYANITAVMSLPKGTKSAPLTNPEAFFSIAEFDQATYEGLSQGLRDVIAKSPEYQEIVRKRSAPNGGDHAGEDDYGVHRGDDDLDDPLPF